MFKNWFKNIFKKVFQIRWNEVLFRSVTVSITRYNNFLNILIHKNFFFSLSEIWLRSLVRKLIRLVSCYKIEYFYQRFFIQKMSKQTIFDIESKGYWFLNFCLILTKNPRVFQFAFIYRHHWPRLKINYLSSREKEIFILKIIRTMNPFHNKEISWKSGSSMIGVQHEKDGFQTGPTFFIIRKKIWGVFLWWRGLRSKFFT